MGQPDPFLGVLLHAIGGLAAASFYLPYRRVRGWQWESTWLAGGLFSWIVAPWALALLLVPETVAIVAAAPGRAVLWTWLFGVLWGIGGLTFGLSMRYLGIALGYAIALGLCAAFGTLVPPLFRGELPHLAASSSGRVLFLGVLICLAGIAVSGRAGIGKERELPDAQKRETVAEFRFVKGLGVAVLAGVLSAAMAYGLDAGQAIVFSTLWGVALREWRGTSRATHAWIGLGLLLLVLSMVVIGRGNQMGVE
ncbi:MAG: L-rhamnose/proton symporter RhaT [Planctomycetota bacterium]